MNDIQETIQAIYIGVVVATFLHMTGRARKAIELCNESLVLLNNKALEKERQLRKSLREAIYKVMFLAYFLVRDYTNAIAYGRKLLAIERESGKRVNEGNHSIQLAAMYEIQNKYVEAKDLYERGISIMNKTGNRKQEAQACTKLGIMLNCLGEFAKAKGYLEKALAIAIEIGDRDEEGSIYGTLGTVVASLGDRVKGKEYLEKGLAIAIEIGDREVEGPSYGNLGTVLISLGDYVKAKEYLEKALAIAIEIGDKKGEESCHGNLGTVFKCLGDYLKAKEYLEKALVIAAEIGDRHGKASNCGNLGSVFISLGEYVKGKEYFERALAIAIEIGDKDVEGSSYAKLGYVFTKLGDHVKAKEYLEKALAIAIEMGHKEGEGSSYGNLGSVFISLGDYVKAKEYYEKALAIAIEIGDRAGEGSSYGKLGTVLRYLGDYLKAKEYLEKSLAIAIEIRHREGQGSSYRELGTVFISLGDYVKAKKYLKEALDIAVQIDDRNGEAHCKLHLGTLLLDQGIDVHDADKYFKDARLIAAETGDRGCEAECYNMRGNLFNHLGKAVKAKKYYGKALVISREIGDRAGEAAIYHNMAGQCILSDEYVKAEEYLEKSLSISKEIQDFQGEYSCYVRFVKAKLPQEKKQEAFPYLFKSIKTCEDRRGFLKDNDEFKLLYSDVYNFPYKVLSTLLCAAGIPEKALYVEELGRARALSDLMAAQYSVERQISADPQSWTGIENISKLESDCTCLYISYDAQNVLLWILKAGGVVEFRRNTVDKKTLYTKQATNSDTFFNNMAESFRSFGILPPEICEDRSFSGIEPKPGSSQEEDLAALRQVGGEDDPRSNLTLFCKMIIAPVTDLLKGSEIIIVPERHLYRVPFPALHDDNGKYLSETFRIRIVPSLTTLKCIQSSPADYHSHSGALIVGDPEVGKVVWKGCRKIIPPLPFARKEAEMVGRLLGVQPLLGLQATKQAVLQRINSVSLIHFAAHGNEEKGEIILAPVRTGGRFPRETDCLLTVGDISQVQLRAKLVVLSCCNSGRGQIKVEGVVGMARAFLGSGARSVLVALWALDDKATEQFMSRFYEHLARGESASESLHQAMKWMRGNGFAKISEWAPFMLIGDDVKFDFGK